MATLSQIAGMVVAEKSSMLIKQRNQQKEGEPIEYDYKHMFTGKKKGWVILDSFTASAINNVYNALNEKNRLLLDSKPLMTAINVVWKLIDKNKQ